MRAHIISFFILYFFFFSPIVSAQKIKTRASATRIEKGDSVGVFWEITDKYTTFNASFQNETLPPKGEYWFKPDSSVKITFTAKYKKKKPVNRALTIDVFEPQLIRFNMPANATDESAVKAEWLAQDVQYVLLTGVPDTFDYYGAHSFSFDTTSTVCMQAVGKYKTIDSCITTQVSYIESFTINNKIFYGTHAKLKWKFKNTKFMKIKGMAQSFEPIGELSVMPDSSATYTIYIHRKNGTIDTMSKTVEVLYPVLDYFKGPSQLVVYEKGIVSWSVSGAPYVIINNDTLPATGMLAIQSDKPDTLVYSLAFYTGKKLQMYLKTVEIINERPFWADPTKKLNDKSRLFCDIISIDQSKYPDEIKIHVLVVDSTGQFIENMAGSQSSSSKMFPALVENIAGKNFNMPFTIKEVGENMSKYDISLVLDHSGSMDGTIEPLEKAVKRFIKKKYQTDRLNVVKFDDQIGNELDFMDSSEVILNKMNFEGLKGYGGSTALYAATDFGRLLLDSANNGNQKVIILFTDGNENSSLFYYGKLAVNANYLAHQLRLSGTKLIAVSYGDGVNRELLSNLARLSGGFYYPLRRSKQIDEVFNEIPRVLHKYYEITYKPNKADGERTVLLKYNTRQQISHTTVMLHIGEKFSLESSDFDTSAYWYDPPAGMLPVSMPQVIALFQFDDAKLQTSSLARLDKLAEMLTANPALMLDVLGHTDLKGSDEYCDKLSVARAEAMKYYLVGKGISENRLRIKGFGKKHPIWNPDKADWKALENRRVEVVMYTF